MGSLSLLGFPAVGPDLGICHATRATPTECCCKLFNVFSGRLLFITLIPTAQVSTGNELTSTFLPARQSLQIKRRSSLVKRTKLGTLGIFYTRSDHGFFLHGVDLGSESL